MNLKIIAILLYVINNAISILWRTINNEWMNGSSVRCAWHLRKRICDLIKGNYQHMHKQMYVSPLRLRTFKFPFSRVRLLESVLFWDFAASHHNHHRFVVVFVAFCRCILVLHCLMVLYEVFSTAFYHFLILDSQWKTPGFNALVY